MNDPTAALNEIAEIAEALRAACERHGIAGSVSLHCHHHDGGRYLSADLHSGAGILVPDEPGTTVRPWRDTGHGYEQRGRVSQSRGVTWTAIETRPLAVPA